MLPALHFSEPTNQLRERATELLAVKKLQNFTPSKSSLHSSKVKRLIGNQRLHPANAWLAVNMNISYLYDLMRFDWIKSLTSPRNLIILPWPSQCFLILIEPPTHLQTSRGQNKNKDLVSSWNQNVFLSVSPVLKLSFIFKWVKQMLNLITGNFMSLYSGEF